MRTSAPARAPRAPRPYTARCSLRGSSHCFPCWLRRRPSARIESGGCTSRQNADGLPEPLVVIRMDEEGIPVCSSAAPGPRNQTTHHCAKRGMERSELTPLRVMCCLEQTRIDDEHARRSVRGELLCGFLGVIHGHGREARFLEARLDGTMLIGRDAGDQHERIGIHSKLFRRPPPPGLTHTAEAGRLGASQDGAAALSRAILTIRDSSSGNRVVGPRARPRLRAGLPPPRNRLAVFPWIRDRQRSSRRR